MKLNEPQSGLHQQKTKTLNSKFIWGWTELYNEHTIENREVCWSMLKRNSSVTNKDSCEYGLKKTVPS